jgi:hypothetical protein
MAAEAVAAGGGGQGNSAVFHRETLPRCVVLVATVNEPSLASA